MFFYKHTEATEYVKKLAYFSRKTQTLRVNSQGFLRLKTQNVQGVIFLQI